MNNYPKKNDFPIWVKVPLKYIEMTKEPNEKYLPWYLFDLENYKIRLNGMKKRYPARTLVPFARHDYSDDVACWDVDRPGKVLIIHDYSSSGYENKYEFDSFEDWYKYILNMVEDNFI